MTNESRCNVYLLAFLIAAARLAGLHSQTDLVSILHRCSA